MASERVEMSKMHWRNKDDEWEVVSTTLHDQWDNAVHPDEHSGFTKTFMCGDSCPRYSPKDSAQWETFRTEEVVNEVMHDRHANRQFIGEIGENVNHLSAEAMVEFLTGTFTAEYKTSDGDTFTRTFPQTREQFLEDRPSDDEMRVLQFTLNKMAEAAEANDSFVSARQAVRLFDRYRNTEAEEFIDIALREVKPALDTTEEPVRDDDGTPVVKEGAVMTEEVADPEQVDKARSMLSEITG